MKVKGFSSEDKAIIKNAFVEKGWSFTEFVKNIQAETGTECLFINY